MSSKTAKALTVIGVILLVVLFIVLRPFGHRLIVKTYFANAMGLRAGAPVRLAGVAIGSVKNVRARPEMREAPAEVTMELSPPYEVRIPSDSTVLLETAGVMGETLVEIDTRGASGPPVESSAVLRSIPTEQLTMEQMIEKVSEVMKLRNCDCDVKKNDGRRSSAQTERTSKPTH